MTLSISHLFFLSYKGLHVDLVHQCGSDSDFEHSQQISSWIRKWTDKFPFLRSLARIIKIWALNNDLNSPYCNTLPTLAFLVMLFTVTEKNAVEITSRNKKQKREEDLFAAKVLLSFFSTYSNWNRKEVVRTKDCVASPSVDEFRSSFSQRDSRGSGFGEMVFIQDPFLKDINLGTKR